MKDENDASLFKASPRVIVTHPNTQHSHYLALGLQKNGCLQAYVTRLYYDETRWPFTLVQFFPKRIQLHVASLMDRRHLPGLNTNQVKSINSWHEWSFIALARLKAPQYIIAWWHKNTVRLFSKRAGRLAIKLGSNILICHNGTGLEAFIVTRNTGILRVLYLTQTHVLTDLRLKQEESKLAGQSSTDWEGTPTERSEIERSVAEVAEADACIVNSTFVKRSLIENNFPEHRIWVIPQGVDLSRFQLIERSIPKKPLKVLYVGKVSQRKGLAYLVEAVRQLQEEGYKIELTLVGDVPVQWDYLDEHRDVFSCLGRIPPYKIHEVYRNADVFVFPSLSEGFGRVLAEAMASGLPVITTTNTMGPDIIEDGIDGFIVPIRDTDSIKERLVYLYNNPKVCISIGISARKKIQQYSWSRYYQAIGDAVNDIAIKLDSLHSNH
jgi:glycosyltransferase involved in cell wall biosynthesis